MLVDARMKMCLSKTCLKQNNFHFDILVYKKNEKKYKDTIRVI